MSETLHIKNFGPIKDMSFDFKKINIFIGDQGTGKSTVGKIYSVFKNFLNFIVLNPENFEEEKDNTWQFHSFLSTFEIKNYLKNETEIFYENKLSNLEVHYKNKIISTNLKRQVSLPPNFNYIVAERVFVSTLADAFFGLNQFGTKLPTLFNRFGNKFSTARKEKVKREYKEILDVSFTHINGVDSIILSDNSIIPLSDGSSGLQGTIPLLVVFDDIVESTNGNIKSLIKDNLLVIEEPELNLFPSTQKKLINYIIANNFELISKEDIKNHPFNKRYKNQLLITTHSPYILTALNNLIYAYEVGQKEPERVERVIDKKYWINSNDVSAYMLLADGTCEGILDKEERLIKAEKLDSISKVLNEEFDALLNIELVQK